MQAFITKRKSPSVNIVTGRVSKISNGRTVAFNNASNSATQSAVQLSCTCTPLNRDPTINTDTAEIRIRAIITFIKGRKVNIHNLGLRILTQKLIFCNFYKLLFSRKKRDFGTISAIYSHKFEILNEKIFDFTVLLYPCSRDAVQKAAIFPLTIAHGCNVFPH